jgi:RNA polymerase sigma-70 factor (ECF subfamily)
MPEEPEALGLLALMLLSDARRDARVRDGELVTLDEQDRSRWDSARIAEGQALVRKCLHRNLPGPYQLQAAINAVHCDAPAAGSTDWRQILLLYDQLLAIAPSAVIALNRAVVVAEVHGPAQALQLIDVLDVRNYHYYHAVRADLLRRAGRPADAVLAYRAALEQCTNPGERSFLARQCQALAGDAGSGTKP